MAIGVARTKESSLSSVTKVIHRLNTLYPVQCILDECTPTLPLLDQKNISKSERIRVRPSPMNLDSKPWVLEKDVSPAVITKLVKTKMSYKPITRCSHLARVLKEGEWEPRRRPKKESFGFISSLGINLTSLLFSSRNWSGKTPRRV